MEKIRLAVDELTVTSFEVGAAPDGPRGTVQARDAATKQTHCGTCDTCNTCVTFCLPNC
jgi:hypothetical protein